MTRALVLSGGGPVGIAWESGLAVGLARGGVDLGAADRIVGTSAGSVVGALLALGVDLAERAERQYRSSGAAAGDGRREEDPDDTYGEEVAPRMQALMQAMAKAAAWEGPREEAWAELGRFAREAHTASEERFLEGFADLAGQPWPDTFACTAIDAFTGAFVVWDHGKGVPLQRAVASSCAVPGVFPPITVGGSRYIDGGMRSALNADLAAGHDRVLVVSVMALDMPGVTDPRYLRLQRQRQAELEVLREGGADVELVGPGPQMREASGHGLFLMDASRSAAAYDAGVAEGEAEAERLRRFWADGAASATT